MFQNISAIITKIEMSTILVFYPSAIYANSLQEHNYKDFEINFKIKHKH